MCSGYGSAGMVFSQGTRKKMSCVSDPMNLSLLFSQLTEYRLLNTAATCQVFSAVSRQHSVAYLNMIRFLWHLGTWFSDPLDSGKLSLTLSKPRPLF